MLKKTSPLAREQHHVDAVIANGENAAGGFGLTSQTADEMFAAGVDFITSGNHIWDKREFRGALEDADRILRPANYPPGSPGRGAGTFTVDGVTVGVLNVMGRVFMPPVDDPFRVARAEVDELRALTPSICVDVHAEATSEKVALGRFLDGDGLADLRHPHPRPDRRRADLRRRHRLPDRRRHDRPLGRRDRHGDRRRARPVHERHLGTVQRSENGYTTILRGSCDG